MPADTATIVLIAESDADADAFRLQIVKNPQIDYPVELVHCHNVGEALAWLSRNEAPYLICIDVDVMESQTGTSFANEQFKSLNRYAPTVWISDDSSAAHVVRFLRKIGVNQDDVFQKNSTLWGSEQTQFLSLVNEMVSRRTSGSSREIQINMARTEEQIKALDKELREMASAISKISSSLFEGGANSVVAIALRYSQQAETYADRRQVTALEDRIKALESKLEEEKTQIKLRRTEFWLALFSRLGFWGITALFLMIFAAIIGVDRAIDLLKALIAK